MLSPLRALEASLTTVLLHVEVVIDNVYTGECTGGVLKQVVNQTGMEGYSPWDPQLRVSRKTGI